MRFPAPLAAPLIAAGLACAAGQASHAATLNVPVNHSLRLPVAGRAASVVVGNAQVADVTVVDSRTLFVTGKSAGSTDVAVVDPLGRTVFAADISVTAGAGRSVTVHRAGETAELSCDPRCLAPSRDGSVVSPTAQVAAPILGAAAAGPGALAGGAIGSAAGGSLGAAGGLPPLSPTAPSPLKRLRPAARLKRFARDSRGATAVEFAMVAGPFFLMMFAVFEYALIYLVTVSLDSATVEAARKIRTGEIQKAQTTAADFKALVCSDMGWLTSQCSSSLYVDARTFGDFSSEASPQPVSANKFDGTQLKFDVGGPGAIVLVTSYFKWTLLTPALQAGFSNVTGGIDVISARTAFRNEPYV